MTARVLQITDGTDTIDFESSSSGYTIVSQGWTPVVAQKNGGPEAYAIVEEEIRLFVEGADEDEAADRLALLRRIIERAQRKEDGDLIDAVLIKYNVDGSVLASPPQALVMGAPENGEILTLPNEYDSEIASVRIGSASDPVIWRFRRRGLLLGAAETTRTSSGNQTAPTLNSVSLVTASDELSPLDFQVKVNGTNLHVSESFPDSFIVIAPYDNIYMLEAESLADGSIFTSAADSANKASGGSVLRFTPASPGVSRSNYSSFTSDVRDSRRVGFFANIRNNSGSTVFKVRAICSDATGGAYTRWTYIPVSQVPTWMYLGAFASNIGFSSFALEVDASAAVDTMDIDSVLIVGLDNDETTILSFTPDVPGGYTPTSLEAMFTHRLLSDVTPDNYWRQNTGQRHYVAYTGLNRVFMRSSNVHVALLAAGKSTATNQWRWTDSAGNPVTFGLTAIRRPGYVVPK